MDMKTIEERLAVRAHQRAVKNAKALTERIREYLSGEVKILVEADKAMPVHENGRMLQVKLDPYRLQTSLQAQVVEDLTAQYIAEERTEFLRKVDELDDIISERVAEQVREQVQRG
jgi:hypothetical protein